MFSMLFDVACWAVNKVLHVEKIMSGKTGKEKRAAVVSALEKLIPLPQQLEGLDDAIIGWLVDRVCETMNWLTDYDFSKVELKEPEVQKVAQALTVSVASVADATGATVSEKLDNLFEKYGVEKVEPVIPVPESKPEPVTTQASPDNKWDRSIAFSLKWEGGRNFDVVNGKPVVKGAAKADTGGATAYGITIPTLKIAYAAGVVKTSDICQLTQAEAKEIYRKNFWERYGWGELPWPICVMCLDCSINHGGFAWILQRSAVECGQRPKVDGKFGPQTFAALKACRPESLAAAIVRQRKTYYENIVARNPSQKVFLAGWLKRNDEMAKLAGL